MNIISFNANGIRAAARKGFFKWLPRQMADVVCIQETKAQEGQLADPVFRPEGYHCYYFDAQRKGYAGTALYSRTEPEDVIRGFGVSEFDNEGRYLEACFKDFSVVSLYAPSGSSGPERQASKDRFLDAFMPYLKSLRRKRREYIICGDWNIAHKEIDLKNWKSNQKNSGFLPHERAWMDKLFESAGYIDAFREVEPGTGLYTWWSHRGRARENNVGWRIDYQVVTPGLRPHIESASIYTDENFSDHAPLIMTYDI